MSAGGRPVQEELFVMVTFPPGAEDGYYVVHENLGDDLPSHPIQDIKFILTTVKRKKKKKGKKITGGGANQPRPKHHRP
jgi:hypothetical protein